MTSVMYLCFGSARIKSTLQEYVADLTSDGRNCRWAGELPCFLGRCRYGLESPWNSFYFSLRYFRGLKAFLVYEEGQLATPRGYPVAHSFADLGAAGRGWPERAVAPQSGQEDTGVKGQIVRKAFQMAVFLAFGGFASHAGMAASIEDIFAEPT